MGINPAAHAGAEGAGATVNHCAAGCGGRSALYFADGVSVASAAAPFSEPLDGAALFLRLAGRRAVGKGQLPAGPNGSEREDREASPSAGVIDSQSVKTTEKRGAFAPLDLLARVITPRPHRHRYLRAFGWHASACCSYPRSRWRP